MTTPSSSQHPPQSENTPIRWLEACKQVRASLPKQRQRRTPKSAARRVAYIHALARKIWRESTKDGHK